ncbi:hydroxyisourate hydrolase [Nocardioides pacificus]
MTTCSTHVLDAALGRPGAGVAVRLLGPDSSEVAHAVTDDDGRIRFDADLAPGPHTLVFATGPWYAAAGRDTLFPEVRVVFGVAAPPDGKRDAGPGRHYHLALLLSPYSYTTYRGS